MLYILILIQARQLGLQHSKKKQDIV